MPVVFLALCCGGAGFSMAPVTRSRTLSEKRWPLSPLLLVASSKLRRGGGDGSSEAFAPAGDVIGWDNLDVWSCGPRILK